LFISLPIARLKMVMDDLNYIIVIDQAL